MANVEYSTNNTSIVAIGDNRFEPALIKIPASTAYAAGLVLKRDTDGSYIAAVAADTALTAVLPFNIANSGSAQASFAFRPIIGGDVRRDLLRVGTTAITDAQADMLRNYSIFALVATDVSRPAP